jgi:hypothetical protein
MMCNTGFFHRWQYAIIFIAIGAINTGAHAEKRLKNDVFQISFEVFHAQMQPVSCKAVRQLVNTDLFGVWVLDLQQGSAGAVSARLELFQNPEWKESLAGRFTLSGSAREMFGDVEEGAVEFEETDNGQDIRAIWKGRVAEGSCNTAILGTRRDVTSNIEQPFVLRRSGW